MKYRQRITLRRYWSGFMRIRRCSGRDSSGWTTLIGKVPNDKRCANGLCTIVSQALEEMKAEQGENFSLATVNLAELQRRTGISRSRLAL